MVIIKGNRRKHRDQAEPEPNQLARRQGSGMLLGDAVIGAIDRQDADEHKHQREEKQSPVEMRNKPAINLHGFLLGRAPDARLPDGSEARYISR